MTYHLDPLRAVAAWFQGFGVPVFGGVNQWGEPIADITPEINSTGAGARPDMDGVDGAGLLVRHHERLLGCGNH